MEWLKDLFDPFKERLKSQFYGTLFFSWLICNWQIPVAVFTDANFFMDGPWKIAYISSLFNVCDFWWRLIVLPIVFSSIYLFVFPEVDKYVFLYRREVERKKLKADLKIIEDHGATTREYLELYRKYEELFQEIDKATKNVLNKEIDLATKITETSSVKHENERLKREIETLNNQNQKLNETLMMLGQRHNANAMLEGEWNFIVHNSLEQEYSNQRVRFHTDTLQKITLDNKSEEIAKIKFFEHDIQAKKVYLLMANLKYDDGNFINAVFCVFEEHSDAEMIKFIGNVDSFFGGNYNIGKRLRLYKRR